MILSRGEKIYAGTILSITSLGIIGGLAYGESLNDAPDSTVAAAELQVGASQANLDLVLSGMSDCSRTVLSTVVAVEEVYEERTRLKYSPVSYEEEREILTETCGETGASEAEGYIEAGVALDYSNRDLDKAIDRNTWSTAEKVDFTLVGFSAGLIAGVIIASSGAIIAESRRNKRIRKKTYLKHAVKI